MTTFYICRHGETENNRNGRLSGWIDTPLTEEGIRNAASSAGKIKNIDFDQIISSDMGRAFITAYLISRDLNYTSPIQRSKDLREVNYGELANMPYASYPLVTPLENADFVAPGGESLAQMQQRVLKYLERISSKNPHKTILLVAHDGTINAIHAQFANENIGIEDAKSANKHDFVAKFEYNDVHILSFDEITSENS